MSDRAFIITFTIWAVLFLLFWGAIAFVAIHFLLKAW